MGKLKKLKRAAQELDLGSNTVDERDERDYRTTVRDDRISDRVLDDLRRAYDQDADGRALSDEGRLLVLVTQAGRLAEQLGHRQVHAETLYRDLLRVAVGAVAWAQAQRAPERVTPRVRDRDRGRGEW
jgi:hypothetical protein